MHHNRQALLQKHVFFRCYSKSSLISYKVRRMILNTPSVQGVFIMGSVSALINEPRDQCLQKLASKWRVLPLTKSGTGRICHQALFVIVLSSGISYACGASSFMIATTVRNDWFSNFALQFKNTVKLRNCR